MPPRPPARRGSRMPNRAARGFPPLAPPPWRKSSSVPRAFAGEEIEAARDHDGGAKPDVRAGDVAEDQVAEQRHIEHLLIEERRDHAGGRVTMRQREQV